MLNVKLLAFELAFHSDTERCFFTLRSSLFTTYPILPTYPQLSGDIPRKSWFY